MKNSKNFVQSLAKGLEVIQTFSEEHPRLTVSEIASLTEYTRPTVRRILITLEMLRFAESTNGVYSLTPRVLALGYSYLSTQNIWENAQPFMRRFVEEVGESCSISVLDGENIIYVARVPAKRIMSINLTVGSRLPAHATSMGHILLAGLSDEQLNKYFETASLMKYTSETIVEEGQLRQKLQDVREQGWARVEQHYEEGLRSIAVPIKNEKGKVIAAINCSAHAGRVSNEKLINDFLPSLQEISEKISLSLTHKQQL